MLNNIPFEEGFRTLLSNNSFELEKRGDIFVIKRDQLVSGQNGKASIGRGFFYLNMQDSLISLEVKDTPLERIVQEAATRYHLDQKQLGRHNNSILSTVA